MGQMNLSARGYHRVLKLARGHYNIVLRNCRGLAEPNATAIGAPCGMPVLKMEPLRSGLSGLQGLRLAPTAAHDVETKRTVSARGRLLR